MMMALSEVFERLQEGEDTHHDQNCRDAICLIREGHII